MTDRSAVVLGADGFDLDVLHNLIRFYRSLGASPVMSEQPLPADLLVVQRPPNRPLDIRGYRAVHIWDYVGTSIDTLLAGVEDGARVTVFTTSDARARELQPSTDATGARLVVLTAPVDVDLWSGFVRPLRHAVVHIGNHKPYYSDGTDVYADRFLAAVRSTRAELWGAGWESSGLVSAGRLGQFRVSGVYGRAGLALGMMYPFQRAISFSGRFWHAPLNGCRLLSEPSVYAGVWPGVIESSYEQHAVEAAVGQPAAREDLQEQARAFWRAHWQVATTIVGSALDGMATGPHRRSSIVDLARSEARLLAHRARA